MGTIIRGLSGTPEYGEWRIECWSAAGNLTWYGRARSYRDAWHVEQIHCTGYTHTVRCCMPSLLGPPPAVEVVEASPEEWPPAGYLGPSWDDLLPTPPAPPKPRGRVLVGAARALVGTVSGRPQ